MNTPPQWDIPLTSRYLQALARWLHLPRHWWAACPTHRTAGSRLWWHQLAPVLSKLSKTERSAYRIELDSLPHPVKGGKCSNPRLVFARSDQPKLQNQNLGLYSHYIFKNGNIVPLLVIVWQSEIYTACCFQSSAKFSLILVRICCWRWSVVG